MTAHLCHLPGAPSRRSPPDRPLPTVTDGCYATINDRFPAVLLYSLPGDDSGQADIQPQRCKPSGRKRWLLGPALQPGAMEVMMLQQHPAHWVKSNPQTTTMTNLTRKRDVIGDRPPSRSQMDNGLQRHLRLSQPSYAGPQRRNRGS